MTRSLGRSNPLVLVGLAVLGMVAAVTVRDLTTGVVLVAVMVLAGIIGLPRQSGPVWRWAVVVLAAASTGWSTWLVGDREVAVAVTAGLRVSVLALPGVALAPLIDPADLADQLAQRLKLPARGVVAAAAALHRIDLMAQTWQQLVRARRARGAGPGRGPVSRISHILSVTFALLVATMRQASAMAVAMDARGFATAQRRTWAELSPWRRLDTVWVVLGVLHVLLGVGLWMSGLG